MSYLTSDALFLIVFQLVEASGNEPKKCAKIFKLEL